ncbi:MAG: CHAT domain-containing protein [Coleofasciculaceae cyanobacterium]
MLPLAVTLIGVMGVLAGIPAPVVGQLNPPLTAGQSAEVEEAKRLHQQAVQLSNQGQYAAAIPLEERALAIREKVLGPEHPDVASSLNNLANQYLALGKYPKAEPLFQRALTIRENVLGSEHPDVAFSLNSLGNLYRLQGKYSKAEPLFQRALAIREKALGPEHPDVATSLHNLANLYRVQGKYPKAEPLYQRALAISEKVLGLEHYYVAIGLYSLADLYFTQGNYSKAEPLYQRALAIYEKVLDSEHPYVAIGLNSLANLYVTQGNYPKAEPLYQRTLAIQEKVLGSEHPDIAKSLNLLGNLYVTQGNYPKAEPLYQRALAIQEKALGLEHPDVTISLNFLANLYLAQGNYAKAEPLFQRSLVIREKALGLEHPGVAVSLNNLALLHHYQGNYAKAEPLYQRALAIYEKTIGLEHPNVALSLNNLALLYWAKGDITRTLEFQTRSTKILERNLDLIFTIGSEARKSAYIATLSGTTDFTISLHLQAAPDDARAARLALTTTLQRKGLILDAVTDNLLSLRQNLKPEDQATFDQLATTRSQLAALIFKKPEDIPLEQYRQQVATLKAEADRLEDTLFRRSAEFRTKSQPVTIEAVQQLIPADAALVELVLYYPVVNPKATKPDERWGNPRYVAYILHHTGESKWIDLGEAEPIDQAVTAFRTALQSDTSDVKPVARALDAKLMQPIRKLLGNTRNVLLSPDSQLNLIPFAALVDENNRYLVENYSINYLSSGRDLLRLQNHAQSRSQSVIVANPDYDKPGDPTSVRIIARGESNHIAAAKPVNVSAQPAQTRGLFDDLIQQVDFAPLPNTAKEAKAISSILPGATVLTGSMATENVIKQLQAPTILHIATHGFFLQDVPLVAPPDFGSTILSGTRSATPKSAPTENPLLRAGLALAGANPRKSGNEDGILTALEAAGLNLSGTKLVVLSACKTGLGDITNGQGVYGLRRAFAIAGAESQLMSLWAVNDYRTNQLMVNYYQRLKNNVGRSEALRQTQLEMLQKPESQHPYYWAAFIPSGDWTAMEQ